MSQASIKARVPSRGRLWTATGVLTLAAFLGAPGLIAPICYWEGRALTGTGPVFLAYAPEAASTHLLIFLFGIGWGATWLVFAMRTWRWGRAYAVVPAVVFALVAWQASRYAYACNPF